MASVVPTTTGAVVAATPLSLGALSASVMRALHSVLMSMCGPAPQSAPTSVGYEVPSSSVTVANAVNFSTMTSWCQLLLRSSCSGGGAMAAVLTCVAVSIWVLLRLKRSRGGFRRDEDPSKGSDGGGSTGDDDSEPASKAPERREGGRGSGTGGFTGYVSYLLGRLTGRGGEIDDQSQGTPTTHQTHSHKKQRKLNRKTKLLEDINLKNNRFYLKGNHHHGGARNLNTEYKGKGGGSGRPPCDHSSSASNSTPVVTAASLAAHVFEEFKKSHLEAQSKTPDPSLPTVIFTMGIPGCGKSTWAKHYVEKVDPTCTIVSSDEIRKELLGDVNDQTVNKLIFEIALCQCQALLRQGRNVILDGTNVLTSARRNFLRRLITGEAPDISLTSSGGGGGGGSRSSARNSASRRSMGGIATNNGRSNSPNGSMGSTSSMGSTTPVTPPPLMQFGAPHHCHTSIGFGSDSLGAVQVLSASDSCRPSPLKDGSLPGGFPTSTTVADSPRSDSRVSRGVAQQPTRGRSQGEITTRAEAMVMAATGASTNVPFTPIVANSPPSPPAATANSIITGTSPVLPTAPDALVPPPIQCNRLLKVFNVTKAVAKSRISRDIQKKVNRSDVPPHVVDTMSVQLQESVSAIKDENWIPLV